MRPRFVSCTTLGILLVSVLVMAAAPVKHVRVANRGIGGQNTREGLSRFSRDVMAVQPNHLIIYFGMNDACNPRKLIPVDKFAENLQAMIDRARKIPAKTIILVTPNPVVDDYLAQRAKNHPCNGKFQEWLNRYDAGIRQVATKNSLPILDLGKLCAQYDGAQITERSLIRNKVNANSIDGVHLTEKGYRLMAEQCAAILKDRIVPGDIVVCFGDSITLGSAMEGQGTAYGETYPAWLWLYLNRQVGATTATTPPSPPIIEPGNLAVNGDFEVSPDGVYAEYWRSYKAPDLLINDAARAHHGSKYIQVKNKSPKPCMFWHTPYIRVRKGQRYQFRFAVRGTGKIRPLIRQYGRRKSIPPFPADEENAWIQGTPDWKEQNYEYTPDPKAGRVLVMFQILGNIDIDAVSLRCIE